MEKRGAVNLIMAPEQNDSSWAALWLHTHSSIRPPLSCNYIFFMWIQLGGGARWSESRDGQHTEAWDDWKGRIKRGFFSALKASRYERDDRERETQRAGIVGNQSVVCESRLDRTGFQRQLSDALSAFVAELDACSGSQVSSLCLLHLR